MTIVALLLAILCAAALALLLRERRTARRNYGRLMCEHRTDLALHGLTSFRKGLLAERARWQKRALDGQEVAR